MGLRRRLLNPFVLNVTAILGLIYAYLGFRLGRSAAAWLALTAAFLLVWAVPALFWSSEREETTPLGRITIRASFLSMGLLSFVLVFTLFRDLLFLIALGPLWMGPAAL